MFDFLITRRDLPILLIIGASTAVTGALSIHFELFERFYEFSRTHEEWELDEAGVLVLNLVGALIWFLIVRSRQLARTVRERDLAEKEAQKIARHDALTGLANRRAFTDHLATGLGEKLPATGRYILMMLDLDRFKAINDLHGHACGDYVLGEFSKRVLKELDDGDFVARLGGDEFAITLAPGSTVARAESVARRLLTAVAVPFHYGDTHLMIGASIGLAQLSNVADAPCALHLADQALYAAKKSGRGQFAWYDAELDEVARERRQLEQDLRLAITNKEITPFFQPVFNITTHKLSGFEALARWNHASRGMIAPEVFIAIAEDIGLIGQLGWEILEQACATARHWDPSLKLAVNFSPMQFRDAHLVETVRKVLADNCFDPTRLEIEVTESAIMLDFELAKSSITQLRDLGVSLALDDFGTGFSSLSNLRQLPFDRIKIDRSFISDIRARPENQKIVAGILALAQGLELAVTAEGIESDDDLSFLQEMECQLGQGFHFARPMAAAEVNWLFETKWSPAGADTADDSDTDYPKAG